MAGPAEGVARGKGKARAAPRTAGRVIAIGGGKGGVGKSVVATNLALTLGRMGHAVTLVDADLGAANLHTLLGVTRIGPGLAGFLDHELESLEAAAIETVVPTVRLVPGSSRPGIANINHGQKLRLLRGIAQLGGDIVIVDVGAGTSFNTLDFVAIADLKLLVVTPQLTSLQNAYAFLKGCVQRVLRRLPEDEAARARLDALFSGGGEARPIQHAIAEVRETDPALADLIVHTLVHFGVGLIGNMVASPREVEVVSRVSRMVSDYLLVHAPVLGAVPMSPAVRASVDTRAPVILGPAGAEVAAALRQVAIAVLGLEIARVGPVPAATQRHPTLPIWIERELR